MSRTLGDTERTIHFGPPVVSECVSKAIPLKAHDDNLLWTLLRNWAMGQDLPFLEEGSAGTPNDETGPRCHSSTQEQNQIQ